MRDVICNSIIFGALISIAAFEVGLLVKNKYKYAILNPLLIAIIIVIVLLKVFHIEYTSYYNGAKYISYLLTPATVCLAVPLYKQFETLKKHWKAIFIGVTSGVFTSFGAIFLLCKLFGLTEQEYVTLLPKSITNAIGVALSTELGGIEAITIAAIMVTGILGNMVGETVCKVFRIHEPVAKGLAIGTSAHVVGTAKAMEMGETEGTVSGLAIPLAGLLTVIIASIFRAYP